MVMKTGFISKNILPRLIKSFTLPQIIFGILTSVIIWIFLLQSSDRSWRFHKDQQESPEIIAQRAYDKAWQDAAELNLTNIVAKASVLHQVLHNPYIFFMFITSSYHKMTHNWLCNTSQMPGVHQRTLVVCSNGTTCDNLQQFWPNATFQAIDHRFATYDQGADFKWGQYAYVNLLTFRAQLVNALVQYRIPVLLIEPDATWFQNPIPYFESFLRDEQGNVNDLGTSSVDMVLSLKGYPQKDHIFAFDPLLIIPTNSSRTLWEELVKRLVNNSDAFDQDVLDDLVGQKWLTKWKTFPWNGKQTLALVTCIEIADGKWYKLSDADKKSSLKHVRIVNNNYYIGLNNKITRQALNGHWFLTTNGTCSQRKVERFLNHRNS